MQPRTHTDAAFKQRKAPSPVVVQNAVAEKKAKPAVMRLDPLVQQIPFKISTTYDASQNQFTYHLDLPSGSIDLDLAIAAAITIQAHWQGYAAREKFILMQGDIAAAIIIQSSIRKHLVARHDIIPGMIKDQVNSGQMDLSAFL